jgi:hypothetical protein
MTATAKEARHGLILLPVKWGCSARAYNRGSIPTSDPRFAGDRGSTPTPRPGPGPLAPPICRGSGTRTRPPPPPPPICQNGGSTPTPGSNRGFRALPSTLPLAHILHETRVAHLVVTAAAAAAAASIQLFECFNFKFDETPLS